MANIFDGGDLKSVQDLQKAILAFRDGLLSVKKTVTDVQTALNNKSKSQADVANNTKKLSAADKELQRIEERGKKVTYETVKANEQLIAKKRQLREEVKKNEKALRTQNKLFSGMVKSIASVAAGYLSIQTAIRVLSGAFNTIRDFGKGTAVLAGVLDITTEETKALTDEAKRLGAALPVTAKDVLDLETAYARLGFSQTEILNLSEATVKGSLALNSGLEETAELTGAVVNTFAEFSTSDAPEIIDILSKSTNKSALNFSKLSTAIPIVGGAANAAGINFTRLIALLGKLSDAGIDASSSSNALKNIFIESSSQGLNYDQILDKIINSSDQLTASTDEFGKRASVSGTILAENIDKVRDLDVELQNNSAGTAGEMAEKQINTLDGAIKGLQSAYEGLILSFDGSSGVFMNLINFLTAILRNHRIVTDVIRDNFSAYRDLFGALGDLLNALGLVNKEEKKGVTFLKILAFTMKATTLPIQLMVKGLTFIIEKLAILSEKIEPVTSKLKVAFGVVGNVVNKIKNKLGITTTEVEENIEGLSDKVENANDNIVESTENANDKIAELEEERIRIAEARAKRLAELEEKQRDFALKQVEKRNKDELKRDENFINAEIELFQNELYNEMYLAEKNLTEQIEEEEQKRLDSYKKRIEQQKEVDDLYKQAREEAEQAVITIITDQYNSSIDAKLAAFNDEIETEKDVLQSKLDNGLISEEAYNEKIKALNKQQREEEARAEKKKALYAIGIQTLVNVVKVIPNFAAIPAVLAIGAIQATAVAAKPIPKYRHGSNGPVMEDQYAIVGDGYKPEMIIDPLGNRMLSPDSPTGVFLQKGSRVLSGEETERIAKKDNEYAELIKETKLTRQAIMSIPKHSSDFTPNAIYNSIKYRNRLERIRRRYI